MSDANNQSNNHWDNNAPNAQQPSQPQYGQPNSGYNQASGIPPQGEYNQQWGQQNPQDPMNYGYQQDPGNPYGSPYQGGPQDPPRQPNQPYQTYQPYAGPYGYPLHNPSQPWNIMSIVGFAISFFIPPVGLILSIVALVQLHRSRERGQGLAVGGVVVGAIFTIFTAILVGLMIWGISMIGSEEYSYEYPSCSGYSCSSDNSGDDSIDSSYLDNALNAEIPAIPAIPADAIDAAPFGFQR
ncbi:DUF4190 domain-containing protein [Bifidobacterium aquikefiri]|uniref:DUF4190 domain-containing protein n=1 Tax=Bifidobacterium aquikefiri TaxID=1653207 RepID=UPI0023F2C637|nr:DUF4190 domain-containing protein [Bifidobacterium aquikefiri]